MRVLKSLSLVWLATLSATWLDAQPAPAENAPGGTTPQATSEELAAWRQGLVSIERSGRRVAVGTVLNGDGRILTVLSTLTHGNDLRARYYDGTTTRARVVHHSRAWDIALLEPLEHVERRGLRAARRSRVGKGEMLRRLAVQGKTLRLLPAHVEERTTLIGHDGAELEGALRLSGYLPAIEWGSPIVSLPAATTSAAAEARGRVTAIVARACAPSRTGTNAPCRLVPYGVPVEAVRAFLADAPAFGAISQQNPKKESG